MEDILNFNAEKAKQNVINRNELILKEELDENDYRKELEPILRSIKAKSIVGTTNMLCENLSEQVISILKRKGFDVEELEPKVEKEFYEINSLSSKKIRVTYSYLIKW